MEVADLRTIQLHAEDAVVADLLKRRFDGGKVDRAVAERAEGAHFVAAHGGLQGKGIYILQVHKGETVAVLADQRRRIHAGKRRVRGIDAEGDDLGIRVRRKVIDITLREHTGAVVRVEADGYAALLGVGAQLVDDGAHLVDHFRVCRALRRAVVAEAAVLAVVPLAADRREEINLLLCDAQGFLHIKGKVAVEVDELHTAVLCELYELIGIVLVKIADKCEVFHIVVAEEFALAEGLGELLLGGLRFVAFDPCPAGIAYFHHNAVSFQNKF